MSKFREYLKEQHYDIKGMYNFPNGDTTVRGSKVRIPAHTPKLGIKNLRLGVESLTSWSNPVAIEACINIMNYFGTPNVLTATKAKWFKIAGFDKVCVKDEAVVSYDPHFHVECVYGTKNMGVSPEFQTPLAAVTQDFLFDNLKQQITARCSSIIGCAIKLGFAEDVIEGGTEANMEEFAERFEAMEVPEWFERATGGVGAYLEFEDRKEQEAMVRQEMMRTGGKYGRGYHWKIGKVPMDMEQDLNIKEAKEGRVKMHVAEFTPSSKEDAKKMTGEFIKYAMKHKATSTQRTRTGGASAQFESQAQRNAFVSAYDKIFRPHGGIMTSTLMKTAYVKEMYVLKSKEAAKKWEDEFTKIVGKVKNKKLMNVLKMKNLSPQEAAKEYAKKELPSNVKLAESKYDIYVDKNEKGQKTYVVYQGKKAIGSFLSDDPTLKKYMKQGQLKGGLQEGKSTTPKHVIDVKMKKGSVAMPFSWKKEYGQPTEANLSKFVKMHNASLKPGGANEHLGPGGTIVWAGLRKNSPGEKPFAEFGKMKEEAKMDVDWKRLEDPDDKDYLDDVLSKAKKMGDDKMIKRIMTMLTSKEKNITNEYP